MFVINSESAFHLIYEQFYFAFIIMTFMVDWALSTELKNIFKDKEILSVWFDICPRGNLWAMGLWEYGLSGTAIYHLELNWTEVKGSEVNWTEVSMCSEIDSLDGSGRNTHRDLIGQRG